MEKYIDEKGFIHDKPINNKGVQTSENGPLFTSVYLSMVNQKGRMLGVAEFYARNSLRESNRLFRTNYLGKFKEDHFSFDNMIGLYYLLEKEELPSTWWWSENKVYFRPLESIFFVAIKYPLLMPFCLLYLVPAMMISINRLPNHTSGAQKWYLKSKMLPYWFYLLTTWTLRRKGFSWYEVFYIYYSTYNEIPDDHPIVKLSKELRI